jgi:hypothetical protein
MLVFVSGMLMELNTVGATDNDYSISGRIITTNTAPAPTANGGKVRVLYKTK